jgi:hypothetical protein
LALLEDISFYYSARDLSCKNQAHGGLHQGKYRATQWADGSFFEGEINSELLHLYYFLGKKHHFWGRLYIFGFKNGCKFW